LTHYAAPGFWRLFKALPETVQQLARVNFELLKSNPHHPSLRLKKVGRFWSVRVSRGYRALGTDIPEGILWFWIGTHADYDKLTG
jgi:hypothetical protein